MSKINFNDITNIGGNINPIKRLDVVLETREIAQEGLRKIRENREKKQTLMEEHEAAKKSYNNTSDLYEPFDEIAFEGKTKIDLIYYDHLLQKITEDEDKLNFVVGDLYKTVRDIYEFVNIKPEVYGRKIDFHFLNESIGTQEKIVTDIVYEYINNHFYNLSPEKRNEKYYEESKELAKDLIKEGMDPNDAIQLSIKQIIMEGLLKRIAFPQSIWVRVKALTEDEAYGKVFDQDQLIEHVELFEKKLFNVSKIVAATI